MNSPATPTGTRRIPAYQSTTQSTLAVRLWKTSSARRPGDAASAPAAPKPGRAKGSSTAALKNCIQRLAVSTGTWPAMRRARRT